MRRFFLKHLFLLSLAFFAAGGVCYGQNYVMTIHGYDGSAQQFDTNNVSRVTIDESQWVSLGIGEYTEDVVASFFIVEGYTNLVVTYPVEIQESSLQPGLYRLVNPYGTDYPYTGIVGMPYDAGNHYLVINASDADGVYIDMQDVGFWSADYGEMYVYSQAAYYMDEAGYTLQDAKNWALTGTLRDGVITFPAQMVLVYFPYYSDILYYGNLSEAFRVVLPAALSEAKKSKALGAGVTMSGVESGLTKKRQE